MPFKPPRPCLYYGCSNVTTNGYCEDHIHIKIEKERKRKIQVEQRRNNPEAKKLYNSQRWRELRKRVLRNCPVCRCGSPTSHADHVLPHKNNPDLFYDPNNLQALCVSCHSRKTAKYDGGFNNKTPRV